VLYLNAGNVVTSDSALTFDGTNLGLGGSPNVAGYKLQVLGSTGVVGIQFTRTGAAPGNWSIAAGGAANTLQFYDQASNSERLRIDSSGNVGIGTTSPSAKLDVSGNAAISGTVTLSGGTANGVLYLNGSKVATTGSALTFDGTNLGVGTASPASYSGYTTLDIDSATNGGLLNIKKAGTTVGYLNGVSGITLLASGSNNLQLTTGGAGNIIFNQNATEGMRLTSTGLGIGASSPAKKLQVASDDTYQAILSGGSNTSQRLYIGYDTSANLGKIQAYFEGVGAKDLVLQPSGGTLGLGVTPSAWATLTGLQVKNGYLAGYLNRVYVGANNYYDGANSRYIASDYATRYYQNASQHIWETAPSGTAGNAITFTQAMTLNASGNLGIGETNPSGRLHVKTTGITASAPGFGWPVYNAENDTNSRSVYIDTAGNGSVSTAGYGATVALVLGQYYDSRVVITASGNGGASPGDQGTANGKDMLIKAGYSENGVGYKGGRLYLSGGMGYTSGGYNGNVGNVIIQPFGGNLGVGTSTPQYKGHFYTATSSGYGIQIGGGSNTAGDFTGILMSASNGGTSSPYYSGAIRIQTTVNTPNFQNPVMVFMLQPNETSDLVDMAERARITSGGYFKASNNGAYYGSTNSYHELRNTTTSARTVVLTHTNATQPLGIYVEYTAAAPNGTGNPFLECADTGGTRFVVRSNGGLANYSGNNVNLSDRREKTNFAPAKSYLDTICAIPVQTFNYIDQSEDDPGLTLGVVAQDVQAVAPELVTESNWGTEDNPKMRLSIYQTDLQYALMKCIQEQQAMINELKADLALLKNSST
jgi:Chaperone of endosialidase